MKYYISFLFFLINFLNYVFSQDVTQSSNAYNLFDSFVEYKNRGVFNGLQYIDDYPENPRIAKTNNKFYGSYNFVKGQIVYNNTPYFNLEIKYDILNDLIILRFVNEKVNFISLSSELVEGFSIQNDKFIRLENNETLSSHYKNGFFKEAFNGSNIAFFVKYKKDKLQDLSEKKIYYVFKEHQDFFMRYNRAYYKLDSKKDILKILPKHEKLIRNFYRKNSILLKKSKQQFFLSLLKYLDGFDSKIIKNQND